MRHTAIQRISMILILALLFSLAAVAEDSMPAAGIEPNEAEILSTNAAEALPEALDEVDLTDISENGAAQNAVPSALELAVKEKYTLSTKGLGKKLTFKSSKPTIASVSKKGVITGVKKGKAVVTVLSGKKEVARCTVTVLAAPSKVSFTPKSITIGVKETVTLAPTLTKNTKAILTWSTKSKKIASVSKTGAIKGVKAGTTTITAKAQNGKKGTLTVNVAKAPDKIALNKTSVTLDIKEIAQLKASLPKKTASYVLTWKSSNNKVATVDGNGKVTAVGPGTARITVTTFNKKKAACTVTVKRPATPAPTAEPTTTPTAEPTEAPTMTPTEAPTTAPTEAPTETPTTEPTTAPTAEPTAEPTTEPTAEPTSQPSSDALGFTIDKTEVDAGEKVTLVITAWPEKYTANETPNDQFALYIYFDETYVGGISKGHDDDTAVINTSGMGAGECSIGLVLCRYDYTTHKEETLHEYDGGKILIKGNDTEDFTVSNGIISGYEGFGGDVTLPSEDAAGNPVVAIGAAAFKGHTAITSVFIPATVTEIGEAAFEGCSGLTEVTLPNGVKKIGKAAFKNCAGLVAMNPYD